MRADSAQPSNTECTVAGKPEEKGANQPHMPATMKRRLQRAMTAGLGRWHISAE
jgi:hypothetical protein